MLDLTIDIIKKGAVDALKIILDSRKRKIRIHQNENGKDNENPDVALRMPKNSEIVNDNDGELGDQQNIDKNEVDNETAEEREERIQKVKSDFEDPETLENDLIKIGIDRQNKELEKVKATQAAARKAAAAAGRAVTIQDFSRFKRDLSRAMSLQTSLSSKPEDTYSRFNPTYANTDFLMPGSGYIEKRNIPIINVYWDVSGSLSSEDVKTGNEALKQLLSLQQQKKIKVNNYWFGDHVVDSPDKWAGGSTEAFPEILEHIVATRATNVIIFTDDDFDSQTIFREISPIQISGCVYWIWCGSIAKRAVPYIRPRNKSNVYEYRLR